MESIEWVQCFVRDSMQERYGVDFVIVVIIECLDDGVGKVFCIFDDLGLEEEMLVIFYFDNGGKFMYVDQAFFRVGKGWLYEGGICVLFILCWFGKIVEGYIIDELMILMDFYFILVVIV